MVAGQLEVIMTRLYERDDKMNYPKVKITKGNEETVSIDASKLVRLDMGNINSAIHTAPLMEIRKASMREELNYHSIYLSPLFDWTIVDDNGVAVLIPTKK